MRRKTGPLRHRSGEEVRWNHICHPHTVLQRILPQAHDRSLVVYLLRWTPISELARDRVRATLDPQHAMAEARVKASEARKKKAREEKVKTHNTPSNRGSPPSSRTVRQPTPVWPSRMLLCGWSTRKFLAKLFAGNSCRRFAKDTTFFR